MKLSLVVSQGNPIGKEIPVRHAQFLIGRDPECQLRPASPLVSKRHCAIVTRGEKVFVRDFGSTNGTHVNGQPVKDEVEIANGDELKFGPLHFRFKIEAESGSLASSETISDRVEASLADTNTLRTAEQKAEKPLATKPASEPTTEDTQVTVPTVKKRSSEDDIADMLFKLDGDSTPGMAIPQGTTVMNVLPAEAEALDKAAEEGAKTPEKPKSGKQNYDNKATSDAAKAILDKYMRRPRG